MNALFNVIKRLTELIDVQNRNNEISLRQEKKHKSGLKKNLFSSTSFCSLKRVNYEKRSSIKDLSTKYGFF